MRYATQTMIGITFRNLTTALLNACWRYGVTCRPARGFGNRVPDRSAETTCNPVRGVSIGIPVPYPVREQSLALSWVSRCSPHAAVPTRALASVSNRLPVYRVRLKFDIGFFADRGPGPG